MTKGKGRRVRPRETASGARGKTTFDSVESESTSAGGASVTAAVDKIQFGYQLAGVCALAFFLRLLHVMQTFQAPTLVHLLGDARGYYDWASRIAAGNWLGSETFYQAPLYPYFLAALIKTLGPSVTVIRIVQSLLGVAGVAAIGVAARRMFTPRVGIVAAAMLAVYPPAIFYDGIVQKAALASVLLCGLLAACVYVQQEQRPWASLLAGVLLGLLVITRENALLWVPVIPVWMLLGIGDAPKKKRWWLAGCCLAGTGIILVPIAARNASFGGEWSPTTFQAGPNFYIGNHLQANGIYQALVPGHETPMHERADAQRLAEHAEGRELSPREVSKFWMKRACEEIGQSPGRWIQLMIAKCFMVVNRYEVPDVENLYLFRRDSSVLSFARPWHFGILCPLAIWGLIASRKQWRTLWLHYTLITSMAVAIVMFFILGRYRHPLAILMIPVAAAGLVDLCRRLKSKDLRSVGVAASVLILVALLCNIRVHEERMLNASSYVNVGIAVGQEGDLRSSIRILQQAIQEFPEMSDAHYNLGRAWSLSGQPQRAIPCYQRALLLNPGFAGADFHLAGALEQLGDQQTALLHYQRAMQISPSDRRPRDAIRRLTDPRE